MLVFDAFWTKIFHFRQKKHGFGSKKTKLIC